MHLESNALVERRAFTLNGFCEAHGISRAMFYKLLKVGQAPRFAKIGTKILITTEAAAEWLRAREVASLRKSTPAYVTANGKKPAN
jgi:predicted DNA-binding transcriptional regulator AlpA